MKNVKPMKFKAGDKVMVRRLGDKTPGEWSAIIKGYVEKGCYIIEWTNGSCDANDPWPCRVFIQSVLDLDTTP